MRSFAKTLVLSIDRLVLGGKTGRQFRRRLCERTAARDVIGCTMAGIWTSGGGRRLPHRQKIIPKLCAPIQCRHCDRSASGSIAGSRNRKAVPRICSPAASSEPRVQSPRPPPGLLPGRQYCARRSARLHEPVQHCKKSRTPQTPVSRTSALCPGDVVERMLDQGNRRSCRFHT